jgi:hypothetical protein
LAVEKQSPVDAQEESVLAKKGQEALDKLYSSALNGIPMVSGSVDDLVEDYLSKYETVEEAAAALVRAQVVKCGTSGFITGFGGLITLPVTIPANLSSVFYVQMRMIAAIAAMGGYDVRSDQVKTLVFVCLTGTSIADLLKEAGVKVGEQVTRSVIKKIPGAVLTKINQRIGFRFITKFGEKGVVNLGKCVPLVGAVIGGGMDVASTRVIGKRAIAEFIV